MREIWASRAVSVIMDFSFAEATINVQRKHKALWVIVIAPKHIMKQDRTTVRDNHKTSTPLPFWEDTNQKTHMFKSQYCQLFSNITETRAHMQRNKTMSGVNSTGMQDQMLSLIVELTLDILLCINKPACFFSNFEFAVILTQNI